MTDIERFYANKRILLTGSTGFMGAMVVEKLLRSFPDINKLYLLARNKGSKNVVQRSKEYFEDPLFERMVKENPNYYTKIVWIEGDLSKPRLDLSVEDLELIQDVQIVLHIGASVKLVNPLHSMLKNNLQGTLELLKICQNCPNILSFMLVSSAYSYSKLSCTHIGEKLYKPALNPETLINLANELSEESFAKLEDAIMDDWPNSYSYTKNSIEYACDGFKQYFPTGIFRPGIITSSYSEPIPFWVKGRSGIVGAYALLELNVIPSYYYKKNTKSQAIPVDMTANALLAATYAVAQNNDGKSTKVYNYTSNNNPITFHEATLISYGEKVKKIFTQNYAFHKIREFLFMFLPFLFMDILLYVTGKKTKNLNLYKQIQIFIQGISYYTMKDFQMDNDNIERLWDSLSTKEKELLPFDVKTIDWKTYFSKVPDGIKMYLTKQK